MSISHNEPIELAVDQFDHGLLMMALAYLSIERGDLAGRAEAIAIRLRGHVMFMELRDLKLRRTKERRNHDERKIGQD